MLRADVAALTAAGLAALAAACSTPATSPLSTPPGTPAAARAHETSGAITRDDLAYRIATLASDEFEGRGPASRGEELTVAWIAEEMAAMGLEPGNPDGTYFQEVPLVEATLDEATSSIAFEVNGAPLETTFGDDVVFWTKRIDETTGFEDAELVFVGYGVVAPEYGWDDYAGVDVEGRVVVMLVNDPGYELDDSEQFNGRAMTYYGRWTYKFEEAARQGAIGAIVIHEEAPASYPWGVVEFSWTGPQFDLVRADGGASRAALEGWVTHETAERLFEAAGYDWTQLRRAARDPGFRAVPLEGLTASATLNTSFREFSSRNVIGVLPGAERPDEHVLYTAHWDHLGVREVGPGEDGIFNGAVDNATGVAAILEIAERMASDPNPPERSVTFLSVTAEEQGLLGSAYFAANPLIDPAHIVGGMNIDGMLPVGRTRDVVVVGYGASELEDILREEAWRQDRYLRADPNPEAGYFYRSDHVELAKIGVPMLYADGGEEHRERGSAYGRELMAQYRALAYHKPADEFSESWDLSGMIEDAELLYRVGRRLADSLAWPNWNEDSEFRAIRDASLAGGG